MIDLEAVPPPEGSADEVITTSIMFGTIPPRLLLQLLIWSGGIKGVKVVRLVMMALQKCRCLLFFFWPNLNDQSNAAD